MKRKVAVFCSSSLNIDASYVALAENVGQALGFAGYDLVWGGCEDSMMGAVARGIQRCGGKATGVILRSMVAQGRAYAAADQRIQVPNLSDRKMAMWHLADAFLVLPGGIGTLDELFDVLANEVLTAKEQPMLALARPVVVLNYAGFYDSLIAFLDMLTEAGMAGSGLGKLHFLSDMTSVVELLGQSRRV